MPELIIDAGTQSMPPTEVVLGSKLLAPPPERAEANGDAPAVDEVEEFYRKNLVEKGELADEQAPLNADQVKTERSTTPEQRNEVTLDRSSGALDKLQKEKAAIEHEIGLIKTEPGMPTMYKNELPRHHARLREIEEAQARLNRQRERLGGVSDPAGSAEGVVVINEKPADVSAEYLEKQAAIEARIKEDDERLRRDLAEIMLSSVERDRQALQEKIDAILPGQRAERAMLEWEMSELQEKRLLPELRKTEQALGDGAGLEGSNRAFYESVRANRTVLENLVAERKVGESQAAATEKSAAIEKTLTGDLWDVRNRASGILSGPAALREDEQAGAQTLIAKAKQLSQRIALVGVAELPVSERQVQIERLLLQMNAVEQEANLEKARTALRLQREQSVTRLERMGGWVHEKSMAIAGEWNKIPSKYRLALSASLMAVSWGAPGLLGAMGGAAYAASTMEVVNKVMLAKRVVGAFATYAFLEKGMKGIQENDRGKGNWEDVLFRRATAGTAAFLVGSGWGADGVKEIGKGVGHLGSLLTNLFGGGGELHHVAEAAGGVVHVTDGSQLVHGDSLDATATKAAASAATVHAEAVPDAAAVHEQAVGAAAKAGKIVADGHPAGIAPEAPTAPGATAPIEAATPHAAEIVTSAPGHDAIAETTAKGVAKAAEAVVDVPKEFATHTLAGNETIWGLLRKDLTDYAAAHHLPVPTARGLNNIVGNILSKADKYNIDPSYVDGLPGKGEILDLHATFGDAHVADMKTMFSHAKDLFGAEPGTVTEAAGHVAIANAGDAVGMAGRAVEHGAKTMAESATQEAHTAIAENADMGTSGMREFVSSFKNPTELFEHASKVGAEHFTAVPPELIGKAVAEKAAYIMDRDMSWLDQKGTFSSTKWVDTALWKDLKGLVAQKAAEGKSLALERSPFNVIAKYLKELAKHVPIQQDEKVEPYIKRALETMANKSR